MTLSHIADRADQVEATYHLADGLYLLGSLERGLTVYSQQVRAHNLAWALHALDKRGVRQLGGVAVIGGGMAGLTLAAGLLLQSRGKVPITLFERRWDLCPLQQGSDTRWLHPRIYDWPRYGSRAPGASLPVLNWSEGRASDVARMAVRRFGECCDEFEDKDKPPSVILGLQHFELRSGSREITWIGSRANRSESYFVGGKPEGNSAVFDTIVLTSGFGLERRVEAYPTSSYWRNEQVGQPILDGSQRRYVVSGSGDGALVDLCRLTIERFRQDTIVYELFGSELDSVERRLAQDMDRPGADTRLLDYFESIESELLGKALIELRRRIRKDTAVMLYVGGADGKGAFAQIFGPTSSYLNRLLTYLLYRCGAFAIGTSSLEESVRDHGARSDHVLCRHGGDVRKHLRSLIADYEDLEPRLEKIAALRAQEPKPKWEPGAFPISNRGYQR